MASKRTLNAKNLEILGVSRLAELLIEVSADNTPLKRQLRQEIGAAVNPKTAGKSILKRLNTIRGHLSPLSAKKTAELAGELECYRKIVLTRLLPVDPDGALYLMLTLVSLDTPLAERVNDLTLALHITLQSAARDLDLIAQTARPRPDELATAVFKAELHNSSPLISLALESLGPVLGEDGLRRLWDLYAQRSREAAVSLAKWPGFNYKAKTKLSTSRETLRLIADALGDVDGFAEQFSLEERRESENAAAIANRLLEAGRNQEALEELDQAVRGEDGAMSDKWMESRASVLESLGRYEAAKKTLWAYFEKSFKPSVLRAILRRLPEHQCANAEHRAIEFAESSPWLGEAANFLASWGAKDRAAALIVANASEVINILHGLLHDIGEKLEDGYPLAATLVYRQIVLELVEREDEYWLKDAAVLLKLCRELANRVQDWQSIPPHDEYERQLRNDLGYSYRFWKLVG